MKKAILSLSLLATLSFAVEINDISQAINIAGKERMFTQKMLKDYAMIGMGNSFGSPKEDLQKTIKAFEEALDALDKFNKDPSIKQAIKKQREKWLEVKKELNSAPDKSKAPKLQRDLEELLKLSNETTVAFAKSSGKKSGEIINISGRQRMLSQRMASLYMLKVWGVNDSEFKKKMDETMKLFEESHKKLASYEKNPAEVTKLLNKVNRSFLFFKIMNKSNKKFIPSLIYKKSDDILKNMNEATILYTKVK
jgi:nitrate/nitrite-specific signal transduction histidine kinase